jgi:HlyD family secretion protein
MTSLEYDASRALVPVSAATNVIDAESMLKSNMRFGMGLIAFLVFGLGGLAAFLPISGAVIGQGEVTVETHAKQLGHPSGGVIADVMVRDGDYVKAGQVLMRLDTTVSAASEMMTGENVDQVMARDARLLAERDDMGAIPFPSALLARANEPGVAALMREEQRAFNLRRQSRSGQLGQLDQRIRQAEQEVKGFEEQAVAFDQQSVLIEEELAAARKLWEQRYTTLARLNALERSAVSIKGDAAAARTNAAQARARISEIRQQAMSVAQESRSQAGTELTQTRTELSELKRNKVAAADGNARNTIRAPQSGTIDKLLFTTIGGVVPPGQTIMEIIPDKDRMIVSGRIRLSDIDQLHEGQLAIMRFSAFNQRTTPEIDGTLNRVSADRRIDEKTGAGYYEVKITIPPQQLKRLGQLKLKPGMPVEIFIQTGERTILSYLLKPVTDQLSRAFREN